MEPIYNGIVNSSCSEDTTVVVYSLCDVDSSSLPNFQIESSVQLCSRIVMDPSFVLQLVIIYTENNGVIGE